MKVVRAKKAGTCYGVQRALDLAHSAAKEAHTVQTLGPLIHNPAVVTHLAAQGVTVAETPEDVSADVVVIRSHGVTPVVRCALEKTGARVVDATCPHVLRAQRAAAQLAREGRVVVVVGEPGHPEVEGLRAWAQDAGGRVIVAFCAADVPADITGPVGVVVQTTQRHSRLEEVTHALECAGVEFSVVDTICDATAERQDAARALASKVDAMVVVGGKNSSNTTRLAEVCAARCANTFHIEDVSELDRAAFAGCAVVGITAGASTPEDQIAPVEAAIAGWVG